MSSASDITPEVRIEAVGSFLQEFIDWQFDEATAAATAPGATHKQLDALIEDHKASLDRLAAFFKAWSDHQK
tara:strand:+ start:1088 stop:1303 length:216 start_codon:yes stop_codon:yes gene_type:complete